VPSLDQANGDHSWQEAIDRELAQINEHETFRFLDKEIQFLPDTNAFHTTLFLMQSLTFGENLASLLEGIAPTHPKKTYILESSAWNPYVQQSH
jgi:hypothetical protein